MRSRIGAAAVFAALCCAALALELKAGQRRPPHIDINNFSTREVLEGELPKLSKPRGDRRALQATGVCSQACYKGEGDCCDAIATSVLYAAINQDRVVRYDPVGDTFERFAEDRINMSRILAIDTSKPWDAYPDDLLVLRQTNPDFSRVFDDVITSIELYDKTGRHVKTLIELSDETPEGPTVQAMTLGPNDTLFLGTFQDGVFLRKYSNRTLGVFGDGVLVLPNILMGVESLLYFVAAPSAIAVDSKPNGDMTVYVLNTRTVRCNPGCSEMLLVGGAYVPSITSYDLTFTDGAYELAGAFTEYFTFPDYKGLEVLDSGDVLLSGRSSNWQLRLVRYIPVVGDAGEFWVFMNSDPGYNIDAWHVKKAPNGLLYVSDFTAFTSSIVMTQDGDLLGQLAATLGYNAGVQGIAFTHGAFATRCNFTSLPDWANAGDSVTVNVTLQNAFGEAVDDELYLELSWQTLSNSALTLIALDVSSSCTRQDVGQYQCVFSPAQATLAFPMEDDEMHVADELLDYLGVTDPHNLTDAELEPFAVQLKVSVASFRVQVPSTTPQRMFVAPTVPSAAYSTMLTSSLSLAAGETGRANLMLADVFGNALATGGYDSNLKIVVATMLNGTYDVGDLHWEGHDHGSFVRLQDQGDGLYTLEAALFTAGTALVQIFLDDVQIKNSPVTIVSIASMDNVSPSTTAVQGLGLDAFEVDDWNSFTLQARDKFGNNVAFSAEIADSAPSSPVPSPMSIADYFDVHFKAGNPKYEVVGMWRQNKDGTFEVMYRVAYPQDASAGADAEFQFTDRWAYPRSVEITVEYNGTVVEMPSSSSTAMAQQSLVFKEYQQQDRLKSLGLAIAVLGAVMVIAHAVYIIVQWNHKIMEFSQQRFLLTMCIGVLMLFAFICVSYVAPSKGICNAGVWLSHLGFVLTVGALTIKTWRVSHLAAHPEKVENKAAMQAVDRHARWTMVAVVVLTVAYLAIWTALDPSGRVEVTTHEESSQGTTTRYKADICSSSGPDFRVALNVFEIALLAAGAVLAYDTRNVHEVFAEAKWIGVSLYNIIVVGGVAALMYTGFGLSHSRPDVAYAILSVCMLVAAGGAINFIMVPKILAILRNEQVDIADLTTSHEMVKSSPSREQVPSVRPMSDPGSISRLPSASKGLSSVVL